MATFAYEWQGLASPAPSSSSESSLGPGAHHGSDTQRAVDPFYGSYPNAPHLRPIELPESDSPMPVFVSPGHNGSTTGPASSRSRPMSMPPPEGNINSLGIYGIPSPPTSPHSSRSNGSSNGSGPSVHPLLRGRTSSFSAQLVYNVLRPPTTHGSSALRTAQGTRVTSNDLNLPATYPTSPGSLRVSVLLYPGGASAGPRRFIWDINLSPSRRASAPPTGPTPLTLGDTLASLHLFFVSPVSEAELRQYPVELQNARAMYAARRAAFPNSPNALVRADFLYRCTEFAGFIRNADNSFSVRLVPSSAMA